MKSATMGYLGSGVISHEIYNYEILRFSVISHEICNNEIFFPCAISHKIFIYEISDAGLTNSQL